MVFGAILAGGTGTRMGVDKPKQFLMLGEKPIIIHTIEKFLLCDKIDHIYVGIHPDWIDYAQDLLDKYIKIEKRIELVPGGIDRNSTIFNIVDAIEKTYGEDDEHIIVTHDSVRPFVTLRMISGIPDRREMFQGQTPQSFKMSMIKNMYYDLTEDEKAILTDACKICCVRDVPVKLVKGEVSNIKITTIDDMKMAQAMI